MNTLLVVPTRQDVGLTSVAIGLLRALERRAVSVGFVKPIAQPPLDRSGRRLGEDHATALVRAATRLDPPDPIDAEALGRFMRDGREQDLLEEVVARCERAGRGYDVLVVEGMVSGEDATPAARLNAQLARAVDAGVVLVASPEDSDLDVGPGAAVAGRAYERAGGGSRVVGCVVNRLPAAGGGSSESQGSAAEQVARSLERQGLALAGAVLEDATLAAPRVSDVIAELKPKVLNRGKAHQRRLERAKVLAMQVPNALMGLTPGTLGITGGDRHDILMAAALQELAGQRLAGLLLTGGLEPDPRVLALIEPAADAGLPILLAVDRYVSGRASGVADGPSGSPRRSGTHRAGDGPCGGRAELLVA